jgi:hypothetical protein
MSAQPQADFDGVLAHEKRISPSLNGRTVLDDKRERAPRNQVVDKRGRSIKDKSAQRSLF